MFAIRVVLLRPSRVDDDSDETRIVVIMLSSTRTALVSLDARTQQINDLAFKCVTFAPSVFPPNGLNVVYKTHAYITLCGRPLSNSVLKVYDKVADHNY